MLILSCLPFAYYGHLRWSQAQELALAVRLNEEADCKVDIQRQLPWYLSIGTQEEDAPKLLSLDHYLSRDNTEDYLRVFDRIARIKVRGDLGRVVEEGEFRKLTGLREVFIESSRAVSEAAFARIAELPGLEVFETGAPGLPLGSVLPRGSPVRELTVHVCPVAPDFVEHLGSFPNIETLELLNCGNVRFPAESSGRVMLPNLRRVRLWLAPIHDQDLRVLVDAAPNLVHLELGDSYLTDRACKSLGKLSRLEWLDVSNTGITDRGLEHLGGLKQLTHFQIRHTRISLRGLIHLRGCRSLRYVDAGYTSTHPRNVDELQAAMPQVKFYVRIFPERH